MKERFRFIALCFTIILGVGLILGTSSASAISLKNKQTFTEDELDNNLKQLGVPDDFVLKMPLDQKQEIISKNPVGFELMETKEFFMDENNELVEINPDEYSTNATIPASALTMYHSRADYGTIGGRRTYRIYVNWDWTDNVFFAYKDKIALSYNDKFQTRVATNGDYQCRSFAVQNGFVTPTSTTCYGTPSEISFAGASWYYDIKKGSRNYGWAGMDIETKSNNNPSGTMILLSHYYHKTGFPGSIGLNIGYVNISVSSGSGYDQRALQSSYYYP